MPVVQHVVFGELLKGQRLLNKIENEAASEDGTPKVSVTIENCGELPEGKQEGTAADSEPLQTAAA